MTQEGRVCSLYSKTSIRKGHIDVFVYKGAGLKRHFERLRDKIREPKCKYDLAVMCGGVCDLSHRERSTKKIKMYDDTPEEASAKSNYS